MAYVVPARPAHGDIVTADDMQKYSDSLNALHASYGDKLINLPAEAVGGDAVLYLRHQFRWLIFNDNGSIVALNGEFETVTLSDPDGLEFYDLNSIEGLAYGAIYKIIDVDMVAEVDVQVIAT